MLFNNHGEGLEEHEAAVGLWPGPQPLAPTFFKVVRSEHRGAEQWVSPLGQEIDKNLRREFRQRVQGSPEAAHVRGRSAPVTRL